jgi:hypothetical protein
VVESVGALDRASSGGTLDATATRVMHDLVALSTSRHA